MDLQFWWSEKQKQQVDEKDAERGDYYYSEDPHQYKNNDGFDAAPQGFQNEQQAITYPTQGNFENAHRFTGMDESHMFVTRPGRFAVYQL